MKRILITFAALVLTFSLFPSCEKVKEPVETEGTENNPTPEQPEEPDVPEDPEDPEDPQPDIKEPVVDYSVAVSLGDVAKELMVWTETDAITAWSINSEGQYGYYDYSERDVRASELSGADATFGFSTLPQGGKSWFAYNSNSGYDGCSAFKVEFDYASSYTQPLAGVVPTSMLRLVSDAVEIPVCSPKTDTTVTLSAYMRLVGTLLKYSVASASGLYGAEKVQSVTFTAIDEYIAGEANAAMAYNFTDNGLYWQNNDGNAFGQECMLIWDATSKSVRTTVAEPASVADSKAVYMPVPPVKVGAYKCVVHTDIAVYTFDFSSEDMQFAENTVMDIVLDLEEEGVKRIAFDDIKGELRYDGGLTMSEFTVSHNAGQGGIGYWFAQVKETGASDWSTRENKETAEYDGTPFYRNVSFSVIDNATGAPADWLSVAYRENDTWWDYTVKANTSEEPRSATVTATYDDVDGFLIGEAYLTKTLIINQEPYSDVKKLDFWGGVGALTIDGAAGTYGWSWWVMTIDSQNAENWALEEHQMLYKAAQFKCYDYTGDVKGAEVDWCKVAYRTNAEGNVSDTWWDVTATENNTGTARKALVVCIFPAIDGYVYANGAVEYVKQEVLTQTPL